MATIPLDFEAIADANGTINIIKKENIPISIKIIRIQVCTNSLCKGRSHPVKLTVNDKPYIENEIIRDCETFQVRRQLAVSSGDVKVHLFCSGFDPGERVTGTGELKFSLNLFGLRELTVPKPLETIPLVRECVPLGPGVITAVKEEVRKAVDREFPGGKLQERNSSWGRHVICWPMGRQKDGTWERKRMSVTPDYDSLRLCLNPSLGEVEGSITISAWGRLDKYIYKCGAEIAVADVEVKATLRLHIRVNLSGASPTAQVTPDLDIRITRVDLRGLGIILEPLKSMLIMYATRKLRDDILRHKSEMERQIAAAFASMTRGSRALEDTGNVTHEEGRNFVELVGLQSLIDDPAVYEQYLDIVDAREVRGISANSLQVFDTSSRLNPEVVSQLLNSQQGHTLTPSISPPAPFIIKDVNITLSFATKPEELDVVLAPAIRITLFSAGISFTLRCNTNLFAAGSFSATGVIGLSFSYVYGMQNVENLNLEIKTFQSPELCPNYPSEPGMCPFVRRLLNNQLCAELQRDGIYGQILANTLNDIIDNTLQGENLTFLSHEEFVKGCGEYFNLCMES